MTRNKPTVRRRRATFGRQEPWARDQLVEQLRQVIGMSLVAFVAARLLNRHGALKLARVWTIIADEVLEESIPDALAHSVTLGVDRSMAFEHALAAVHGDEGIMLGRGMEIASGTIEGGLRCLLPACDLDEFLDRVRDAGRTVAQVNDLPEAPLRDAPPRRIG